MSEPCRCRHPVISAGRCIYCKREVNVKLLAHPAPHRMPDLRLTDQDHTRRGEAW